MVSVGTNGCRELVGDCWSNHRAYRVLPRDMRATWGAVVIGVLLSASCALLANPICLLWREILKFWSEGSGLAAVMSSSMTLPGIGEVSIPYLSLPADHPGTGAIILSICLVAVVLTVSALLPQRLKPLAFLMRAIAVVHVTAILRFGLNFGPFPHDLPSYSAMMMSLGLIIVIVAPAMLGLTYYIFDISVWKKAALTILLIGHLLVFIPCQYAAQVYFIHTFNLLYMPVMYMFFGVLADSLVFVCFYAWGMSWKSRLNIAGSTGVTNCSLGGQDR